MPASDVTPALPADADLLAFVVEPVPDTRRAAVGARQRDIRDVDRHVLVDDAALHRRSSGFLMPPRHVDPVDDDTTAVGEHARHLALLADVLTFQHDDAVALADLELRYTGRRHHRTSGASDTIRMKRRSRSSRPTGPKIRVPRGCIWSLMRTAAFSSKRM